MPVTEIMQPPAGRLDSMTPMHEHRAGRQHRTPSGQVWVLDGISPMMLDLKMEPCCLYLQITQRSLLLMLCFTTGLFI